MAFRRFSAGGELPAVQLGAVLQAAGQHQVQEPWIAEILHDVFRDRGHLDRSDFFDFVARYEERQKRTLEAEFQTADLDGTGWMSAGELSAYLRGKGATPVPGVVEEMILEVTGSASCAAQLSVEDFLQVHLILQERAGFTVKETACLKDVFLRFGGRDHQIQSSRLRAAIAWMGFATSQEAIEGFVEDAGLPRSGGMSFGDFLVLCRRHREHTINQYRDAFHDADKDRSGTINAEELPTVFEDLGYMAASPQVLLECRTLCSLDRKRELMFEDLIVLLDRFRSKDGFLQSELEEIAEVFDKFSSEDGKEGLASIHLGAATRWIGFPVSIEQVQELCEEHDMDGSGGLDHLEFVRLMMCYRELEIGRVRRVFAAHDVDSSAKLCAKELRTVLLASSVMPAQVSIEGVLQRLGGDAWQELELGLWEFADVVAMYRREARDEIRVQQGFTDPEVKRLRKQFRQFDPKDTGSVGDRNLADMLADHFPDAQTSLDAHTEIRELLRVSDVSGDGQLQWDEYLLMMRRVQDQQDKSRLSKLDKAIKATGFKREELAEFRKIFHIFDTDASGDLSFEEFENMICNIVPRTSVRGDRAQELNNLLRKVDEDDNRVLDLAEFLRLLWALMESNWNGINVAAAANFSGQSLGGGNAWE